MLTTVIVVDADERLLNEVADLEELVVRYQRAYQQQRVELDDARKEIHSAERRIESLHRLLSNSL